MQLSYLIVLGLLLLTLTDALRSCVTNGQVRVPCQDELLLGESDKFLLTLFGHTCYTINIVSPQPLEVQFYDSTELESSANSNQGHRRLQMETTEGTNETVSSLAALGRNDACHNVLSCVQLQEGLSRAATYNLVISRWANVSDESESEVDKEEGLIRVTVELEHCDPVSPWHYVGLVFVCSIGLTSTMLLLCIVGEFVLGLQTTTRLQQAVRRDRFVKVVQVDPVKQTKEVEKKLDELEKNQVLTYDGPKLQQPVEVGAGQGIRIMNGSLSLLDNKLSNSVAL
ncbi:unnamed protein product [Peronospora belbahrii]|uniref:Uncharacterized protein n=1 Tax=Peronospora belbahrii TaxID=622444 RepID=A0AAU9KUG0_9STRA|nr:unnamed protein product [Peronospora belbahrii]